MTVPSPCSIVWLRRDLRLYDHAALAEALNSPEPVQVIFVFDSDILRNFSNPRDRRLTFIARTLVQINHQLKQRGGELLVLHGRAPEVVPSIANVLHATRVIADEDYEPSARSRDDAIARELGSRMIWVKDHLIFAPTEILLDNHSPYKVFTPYSRVWLAKLGALRTQPFEIQDEGRYSAGASLAARDPNAAYRVIPVDSGASGILEAIGYELLEDDLWLPERGPKALAGFISQGANRYSEKRDMLAENATSRISPYLRFGLLSIRDCVGQALEVGAGKWLSELIWREFYAMILFHFPESAETEWNSRYRDRLNWANNPDYISAWKEGKTGYPVVDAAMRQLLQEGWMHNRARMIVASFLTKHLRVDWRIGEQHFAQLLMDYDATSNVGGWQWAASTGTDAQPYFRVFNPLLQSQKFDPDGAYIRRYVPELKNVPTEEIHGPVKSSLFSGYYPPIVDHKLARAAAIEMFGEV